MQCGFVIVPEDRYGDPQDTIRLAVARIASNNPTPDPAPIIFLPGGPGSPVLTHISDYYESFIVPMRGDRDIILFDPRGVGLSEPEMDCWGLKLTYLRDLSQEFSDAELADKYLESLFTCRNQLQDDGVNLAAYHSAAMAADVKDILQVMEYDQAHLYGVSYGTRLAQQIMRDYPDWVKTAVLDSVVPMDNRFIPQSADWQGDALQDLFESCADHRYCQSSYPDLETTYHDLQTTLATAPLLVTLTDPIRGNEIEIEVGPASLDSALNWALPNPYLFPYIPKMLYDLREDDTALLSSALSLPLLTYGDSSLGMIISVLCHDQVSTLIPEQLATGPTTYPQLGLLNTVSPYKNGRFLPDLCQQWGAAAPEAGANEPVHSDIPTLILAGQLDATTPPVFGRHVAETLSRSYFIELPNQGHVPSFGPMAGCVQAMLRAFLIEPRLKPVNTCSTKRSQPAFFVAYDGTEEIPLRPFTPDDLPYTVMVPVDWEASAHNHFYWLRYPADEALLAVQASPVSIEEWLDFLMGSYADVGLETFPEYMGEINVNGRIWHLYKTTFNNSHITFAFAQEAGVTYHIKIASTDQEHDLLYEHLLLAVLASVKRN